MGDAIKGPCPCETALIRHDIYSTHRGHIRIEWITNMKDQNPEDIRAWFDLVREKIVRETNTHTPANPATETEA